jgi:ubiquinone/menaquinone biosynthesis C-methylase UbiE
MDQTGRMPDVDVPRIFDRVAHLYDIGWVQRALYTAVQDRALSELRAWRPGAVLDVGCGTGIFAERLDRELAPGGVAGCDLSAGMLAEGAARSRRVGWVRGDSARLPFRRGAFDAVVCTQAFHFFDQPQAWAEFHRLLAPGGHALVGMIHPRTSLGSRRFTRLSSAGSKTKVTFPTAPEMRRMATAAGFEVIAQPQVAWRFRPIVPLVLTIGRA